jgi:SAM-dependent methyltransferase
MAPGPDTYNESYKQPNYFHYSPRLYRHYVAGLVAACALPMGSRLLDAGCGQGMFSYLFWKLGMDVLGVDLSQAGIEAAASEYGAPGLQFAVADLSALPPQDEFDCIFVRSCSLYNAGDFPHERTFTLSLMRHLRPGGTLIFTYNSKLDPKLKPTWRYHTLEETREHFRIFPGARTYFLNKLAPLLLRRYAFNSVASWLCVAFTRLTGSGGELVCLVPKQDERQAHDHQN